MICNLIAVNEVLGGGGESRELKVEKRRRGLDDDKVLMRVTK
ncbi:unnamed protein product [Staurois parvus]|uniref:Uncharacterized protein n=1 Tax=Staurois parvus TaxID=386267 RepID=A0ABN9AT09_9NEOB|nr:unnamed protein product [Staurois parvus]